MKKLIRLVLILVVLIIAGVVAAFFYIDTIAKSAVERGGTYALGVDTKLKSASVHLFSGQFTMSGLNVANPQGYDADHFLRLGDGDVAVTLASLRQDVIRLPTLSLKTLDVNLEKKGDKANYQVILDNLKKLSSGEKPAAAEGGAKYVIDNVDIRRINVHVKLLGQNLDVPIDHVRLKNVGTADGANGLSMSQVAGVIVKAVFDAVVQKAGNILPADIMGDLTNRVKDLANFDKLAQIAEIGDVKSAIEGVVGGAGLPVGGGADDLKKKADDLANKAKEGLGGVLGGSKPTTRPDR